MESGSVVARGENSGENCRVVFAPRPAREKSVAIAVVATVILHLMAFGAMVGGAVINILTEEKDDEIISNAPADKGREVLVELDALELMAMREALEQTSVAPETFDRAAEDASLPELVETEAKSFVETSREQESERAVEGAVLIGERNTEEGSELAPSRGMGRQFRPREEEKLKETREFSPTPISHRERTKVRLVPEIPQRNSQDLLLERPRAQPRQMLRPRLRQSAT